MDNMVWMFVLELILALFVKEGSAVKCFVCVGALDGFHDPVTCPNVDDPTTTTKQECSEADTCLTFRGLQKYGSTELAEGVYRSCGDRYSKTLFDVPDYPFGSGDSSVPSCAKTATSTPYSDVRMIFQGEACICHGQLCNRGAASSGNSLIIFILSSFVLFVLSTV